MTGLSVHIQNVRVHRSNPHKCSSRSATHFKPVSFRQWQNLFALFAYKFKIRKHSLCRLEFIYTIRFALKVHARSIQLKADCVSHRCHRIKQILSRCTYQPNYVCSKHTEKDEKREKNQVHLINFSTKRALVLFTTFDGAFFFCRYSPIGAVGRFLVQQHRFGLVIQFNRVVGFRCNVECICSVLSVFVLIKPFCDTQQSATLSFHKSTTNSVIQNEQTNKQWLAINRRFATATILRFLDLIHFISHSLKQF